MQCSANLKNVNTASWRLIKVKAIFYNYRSVIYMPPKIIKSFEEKLLKLKIQKLEYDLDNSLKSQIRKNIATYILVIITIFSFFFGVWQFVITTNKSDSYHLETRMYTLLDNLNEYQGFSHGKIKIYINNLSKIGEALPQNEVFIIRSILDVICNTGYKSLADSELIEALYSNYDDLDEILIRNYYLRNDFHSNLLVSINLLSHKNRKWHKSIYYWDQMKQFSFSLYLSELKIDIEYPNTQIGLNLLNGLLFIDRLESKIGEYKTYSDYCLMKDIISERIANQYFQGALNLNIDRLISNEIKKSGLKDNKETRKLIKCFFENKHTASIKEADLVHNAITDKIGRQMWFNQKMKSYKK